MSETRRSWEFAAIPLTIVLLGILAVIMWAFSAGLWAWIVLGIVLAGALIALTVAYMARPHHPAPPPSPSRPDGAPEPPGDGIHRVLVIADDACAASDLGAAIARQAAASATRAFVIAPALGSRSARWTSDDHAYTEAGAHLEATLAALAELQVRADGHVGSHDPLQAADDGLREFPADEIVFAVHPAGETNWLEKGVADAARSRYPIPVRTVRVPSSAA